MQTIAIENASKTQEKRPKNRLCKRTKIGIRRHLWNEPKIYLTKGKAPLAHSQYFMTSQVEICCLQKFIILTF